MLRLNDSLISKIQIQGLQRTEAFEEDLKYFLGENWKNNYTPR